MGHFLRNWIIWLSSILMLGSCGMPIDIPLHPGLIIRQSTNIQTGTYLLPHTHRTPGNYQILIKGTELTVDFQGATLRGTELSIPSDQHQGTAILIRNSGHVTLKNLKLEGYKIPIRIEKTASVRLENCDIRGFFQLPDPDSIDLSIDNPWNHTGAAILIQECYQPRIVNSRIASGGVGIWLDESHEGEFGRIQFDSLSQFGMVLTNSSQHVVHHTRIQSTPKLVPTSPILFGPWSQHNLFGWNDWRACPFIYDDQKNYYFDNLLTVKDSTFLQLDSMPAALLPYAAESIPGL